MAASRSTAAPPRRGSGRHARDSPSWSTDNAGAPGAVRRRRSRRPMAHIVLLALAAAVFPTLIACVAIMISRPDPRRLLVAFYAGGLIVSIFAGIVVLNAFKRGDSLAGNGSSSPNPGTSIVMGLL